MLLKLEISTKCLCYSFTRSRGYLSKLICAQIFVIMCANFCDQVVQSCANVCDHVMQILCKFCANVVFFLCKRGVHPKNRKRAHAVFCKHKKPPTQPPPPTQGRRCKGVQGGVTSRSGPVPRLGGGAPSQSRLSWVSPLGICRVPKHSP